MSSHVPQKPGHQEHDWLREHHVPAIAAILLIALGVVFFLLNTDALSHGSSWWVIFLAIPGLGLFWNTYTAYQEKHELGTAEWAEIIFGAVLVLLSVIFIFDPTFSFIRLNQTFPDVVWENVWPFALIVPGAVLAVMGARRSLAMLTFGVILAIVGGVFLFDINWDHVWPFALVALGVFVLFYRSQAE
jgi:hypothetical protein